MKCTCPATVGDDSLCKLTEEQHLALEREKLAAVADVVLAYRPKSKQPKPRKRKKRVKRG